LTRDFFRSSLRVDHRQAPDLQPRHLMFDLIDGIVLEAAAHVVGHHDVHRDRVGKHAVGRCPYGDAAIGDDADQQPALARLRGRSRRDGP
jgi:hypothetical protein